MKRITSLLGVVALSALTLAGCKKEYPYENAPQRRAEPVKPIEKPVEIRNYFAEIQEYTSDLGLALASGDFDEDGDLDLISLVGIYENSDSKARFHFFENDGKGNFKLRRYPVK